MNTRTRQSSFLADEQLLNEFAIWCVRNNTTRTAQIVKFIKECTKDHSES